MTDVMLRQERDTGEHLDAMKQQLARVVTAFGATRTSSSTSDALVARLRGWLSAQERREVEKKCLHALYFTELPRREDSVKDASKHTFQWTFEDSRNAESQIDQSKHTFRAWLRSDESDHNIFWIFGRPGAGKSTLMETRRLSQRPESQSPGVVVRKSSYYCPILFLEIW